MEQRISPLMFLLATIVFMTVLLGASIMLPHDRYYRFQAHDTVTTRKADWIYERLHFDQTPIDVALIGTSRMVGGLSGPQIETAYCRATGRRIRVANLAIPVTGRNMHYLLARETMRAKPPALLVIELNEIETRRPHADFIFLADARDVLSAPVMLNLNYVSDILRLPGRQASLFVQTVTATPSVQRTFDRNAYLGANLDRTEQIHFIDGRTKSRDVVKTPQQMEALSKHRDASISPLYLLPKALRPLEYRFSRYYLRKIEALALQHGAGIAYAYLPAYRAANIRPGLLDELAIKAPIFDLGGAIANDPAKWLDATHVNSNGAKTQSLRFANILAAQNPNLGIEGCGALLNADQAPLSAGP